MKTILGSAKKDRNYITLSFLSGFALILLYLIMVEVIKLNPFPSVLILILIYSVLFDVNHYFSTLYKVFLDKKYYRENRNWMLPGLSIVTIGSMAAFFAITTENFSYDSYLFFLFFRRFVLILGLYHLVKQNWGFMAIYKGMAGERRTKINWNQLALLSGSFMPLIVLTLYSPIWFENDVYLYTPRPSQEAYVINFAEKIVYLNFICAIIFGAIALTVKKFQYSLPAKNMAFYCLGIGLLTHAFITYPYKSVLYVLLVAFALIFIVSFIQSILLQRKEADINRRKWEVFATSLILYWGVIFFPIYYDIDGQYGIIVAAITLPHNIQYLAFVPAFSRNLYRESKADHGIAKFLAKRVVMLFFIGVLFSMVFELGRNGSMYLLPEDSSWTPTKMGISVFFLSIVLHHYYLDAVIWKFGRDKELQKGLDK